jgi:hypothetical protein
MRRCCGAVIIALERSYFPSGLDKPGGSKEKALTEIRLATPWNQIEASMAYAFGLPLLVIVEAGIKDEGLLEHGNDWYVQRVALTADSLSSLEFNGILASWKHKLEQIPTDLTPAPSKTADPAEMSIEQLLRGLKPGQLWSVLAAIAALVAGAFELGAHLVGAK